MHRRIDLLLEFYCNVVKTKKEVQLKGCGQDNVM